MADANDLLLTLLNLEDSSNKGCVEMEIVRLYEAYTEESTAYLDFIEQLVSTDFALLSSEVILDSLKTAKIKFEKLMEQASQLEVAPDQEENLKDLKYLIMDHLFLARDLACFYEINELGRFKMRALNAINKKRRAEVFNGFSSNAGSCPIGKQ